MSSAGTGAAQKTKRALWASVLGSLVMLHAQGEENGASSANDASGILRRPIPDKLVVLTFDDGCASHYRRVAPLLKKLGFGGTFFVCDGFSFRTRKDWYLTWRQMRAMADEGLEVGNHTAGHAGRASIQYFLRNNMRGGISGPGGITMAGAPGSWGPGNGGRLVLCGTNTYSGPTEVKEGTLSLAGPKSLGEKAEVRIARGATLALNFSGKMRVRTLDIDGERQPAGIYRTVNFPQSIVGTGTIVVPRTDGGAVRTKTRE